MESSSRKVIFAALTANLAIAVGKFATAIITGSSSMLAEGFHSSADTGNSLLLLLGVHRSNRPAEPLHPFGHGKELYFWSFVVSVSIFAVGGVLSIWEGIRHIQHPSLSGNLLWNYGVLAFAGIMDGFSLFVSFRQVLRTNFSEHCISEWASSSGSRKTTPSVESTRAPLTPEISRTSASVPWYSCARHSTSPESPSWLRS
jgi:cation diffusion facilitator family transporter